MKVFSNKQSLLPFYWRTVVKPNIWQALPISLLMLFGAIFETMTISLTVPLVDSIMGPSGAHTGRFLPLITEMLRFLRLPHGKDEVTFWLLGFACILFIIGSGFSLVQQYCIIAVAQKLRRKLKYALFENSLRARYEDQLKRGRGTILKDIDSPPNSTCSAIGTLGALFTGIFNSIVLVALMVYLSWWAALLVGGIAIGGIHGLRKILDRRAYVLGSHVYELQRELGKVEIDAIDGLKLVKANVLESTMVKRQRSILEREAKHTLRLALFNFSPSCVNEVAAGLIVLALGGMTFLFPAVGMSFSIMVAFLLAIRRIAPAIASINSATMKLNQLRRDIEVIEEVLHLMPPEKQGQRLVSEIEEIRLVNVSFCYASRSEESVLKGIDLILRKGSMTAIVGATGAGKSTIANLLVGLYTPSSGAIFVNDIGLQQLNMAGWRRKIGYVCQDTFLFNATLRENIVLWDEGVSEADIQWASKVAQMHEFVLTLPDGYDTVVGDRGVKLSGGQCQRVAIARAILRRPQVLIFDEATSALDNLTEKAVYEAISALRANALVLVIAHRLSTVRDADEIVVLQSGKVIETGTHNSLMNMRGSYAALYEGDGYKSSEIPAESVLDRQPN